MPAAYEKMRDQCIGDKKKKNGGKISDKEIQNCKKMSAIQYFKKTGKPVQHADATEDPSLADPIELDILDEQIAVFGSLEEYFIWSENVE